MANFDEAYKIVRKNEGGYANDPDDRGGETYKGISRNNFPKWIGWKIIDGYKEQQYFPIPLEKDTILQKLVLDFFSQEFWDTLHLDAVSDQMIAIELFDMAVNMGTGVAALFLQQVLNITNRNQQDYPDIKEDAIIGVVTIGYLNAHKSPGDVFKLLNCLRGSRYFEICRHNPTQEKYMKSWLSRITV